jgi:hypothetical protein
VFWRNYFYRVHLVKQHHLLTVRPEKTAVVEPSQLIKDAVKEQADEEEMVEAFEGDWERELERELEQAS